MVFSGTILVCTYGVSPQLGVCFVCNKPNIHIQIAAPTDHPFTGANTSCTLTADQTHGLTAGKRTSRQGQTSWFGLAPVHWFEVDVTH
jgi:hypothetical protein